MTFYLDNFSVQQLGFESRQRNRNLANKFNAKKSGERTMAAASGLHMLAGEAGETRPTGGPLLSHIRKPSSPQGQKGLAKHFAVILLGHILLTLNGSAQPHINVS